MRVQVTASAPGVKTQCWGGDHPWKNRLTHGTYDPADSGWLLDL